MKGIWDRRLTAIAAAALLSAGCLGGLLPKPSTPAPKPPIVDVPQPPATPRATLAIIVVDRAGAPIADARVRIDDHELRANRDGYAALEREHGARRVVVDAPGFKSADVTIRLAGNADHRITLEREASLLRGRLRVDGRYFVDASGRTFRPVFTSALTLLTKSPEERAAFLDWAAAAGFNGVRIFGGALTWAGQTPDSALAALPAVLQETSARGLYVLLSVITDSRDGGYDIERHLRLTAALTAGAEHVLLEAGNELFHPTQSERVNDIPSFCALAREVLVDYPNPWALGAAAVDEPVKADPACSGDGCDYHYPADCGRFNTSHLDRGRDLLNQARRVRELRAIADETGKPIINAEPLGAGEADEPGRRSAQPYFFAALGALNYGFGVGGVWHAEDALFARVPGPRQQESARAFVEASRLGDEHLRFDYRNARWANSPVVDAHFEDAGGPIVRAYSFIEPGDASGFAIVLSVPAMGRDAVTWGNGWRLGEPIRTWPHVAALRVVK